MPKRNLAWILVIVMIALLMWQLPQTIARRDSVSRAFGPLVDARAQIHRRFVREIDDNVLVAAAVRDGIRGMLAVLHDPYARYFTQKEHERLQDRTNGRFGGLGVEVWATPVGLEVARVARNSPAQEAGFAPGWVITDVDGVSMVGLPLVDVASELLNGVPGTTVKLTVVEPSGAAPSIPREVVLRRAVIHIESIRGWRRVSGGGWRYVIDPEARVAYIQLTKFRIGVSESLKAVIERLLRERMRALILDLRGNPGGVLDSARDVADLFLSDGLIVSTDGHRAHRVEWFAQRHETYSFPVAVLINGQSASASEIVAGALRDHRRAVIVGERSFGKGSVQEVIALTGGNGAIKLTTAYYFLPSGKCVHRTQKTTDAESWGVAPTITVAMNDEQRRASIRVWRSLQSEPVPEVSSTRPEGHAMTALRQAKDDKASVRRLEEADPQLRKALEFMRRAVGSPASTRPVLDSQSVGQ